MYTLSLLDLEHLRLALDALEWTHAGAAMLFSCLGIRFQCPISHPRHFFQNQTKALMEEIEVSGTSLVVRLVSMSVPGPFFLSFHKGRSSFISRPCLQDGSFCEQLVFENIDQVPSVLRVDLMLRRPFLFDRVVSTATVQHGELEPEKVTPMTVVFKGARVLELLLLKTTRRMKDLEDEASASTVVVEEEEEEFVLVGSSLIHEEKEPNNNNSTVIIESNSDSNVAESLSAFLERNQLQCMRCGSQDAHSLNPLDCFCVFCNSCIANSVSADDFKCQCNLSFPEWALRRALPVSVFQNLQQKSLQLALDAMGHLLVNCPKCQFKFEASS